MSLAAAHKRPLDVDGKPRQRLTNQQLGDLALAEFQMWKSARDRGDTDAMALHDAEIDALSKEMQ